ncbi:hypothetical protein [Rossellomorea sp. KS-H15a]|uniref:hypothetical protein n=1 Tax=Rossellomorea sp. KS-H15a TaxID=2963940 RepID=UPI0020C63DBC|nr:hypothetical protein [Rossellomorea sp. KS-H15a]UTE78136.1 hypothetical protein M1J35_05055 [Rossellomorea sp. KS-H15a]
MIDIISLGRLIGFISLCFCNEYHLLDRSYLHGSERYSEGMSVLVVLLVCSTTSSLKIQLPIL